MGPGDGDWSALYAWPANRQRVIVPVSDEGPCFGNPCSLIEDPNSPLQGCDGDSIRHAISVALANDVIVSPIISDIGNFQANGECVVRAGELLARNTHGTLINFNPGGQQGTISDAITQILDAVCACE